MQVRFYAVGRELAGTDACECDATDVRALHAELEQRFGARMGQLVAASTLLHNGIRRSAKDDVTFAASDTVDLLPPFAGG